MPLGNFRFEYDNANYFYNVEYFFNSFEHYIERVEQWISKEHAKSKDNLVRFEEAFKTDPNWEDEWFIHHGDLRQKILLRVIYYESLLIAIYSFVEKQLFFTCQMISKKYPIKVDDISGKGIFKYRTYLNKVAGVNFNSIQNEWEVLQRLRKIRNFVVHSHSFRQFSKTNKDLEEALTFFPSIKLTKYEHHIGFDFQDTVILKDFCRTGRTILNHIYYERSDER